MKIWTKNFLRIPTFMPECNRKLEFFLDVNTAEGKTNNMDDWTNFIACRSLSLHDSSIATSPVQII